MNEEQMKTTNCQYPYNLRPSLTPGARLDQVGETGWRFEIPAGPAGRYRLAQLDNYGALPRRSFPYRPSLRLRLRARASSAVIPGTWGFGLWNNPFSMAILSGVEVLRLPALPNTAWFFFASPPNYLSFRDDLPAQGWLAATFRSPQLPSGLLAAGAPALPLAAFSSTARFLRRLARRFIQQEAVQLSVDVRDWHTYEVDWQPEQAVFRVDGEVVLETQAPPLAPLGLVLWVDNQYAGLTPRGELRFGTLETPQPAWIEIQDLSIASSS